MLDDNLLLLGCVAALVEYLKLNDSDLLRHLLIDLDLFLEFFLQRAHSVLQLPLLGEKLGLPLLGLQLLLPQEVHHTLHRVGGTA